MLTKSNFKRWFHRYKYAEGTSTFLTIIVVAFSQALSDLAIAYLITFVEYFAFYGVLTITAYITMHLHNKKKLQKTTAIECVTTGKNLILECGYPAAIDFFFTRPFFMYWIPLLIGNPFIGVLLAKFSADACFYVPAIFNLELITRKDKKLKPKVCTE